MEVEAEMEEGVEAWVGVVLATEVEETEVSQGCGCAMMCICLNFPFGTGKTHVLYRWIRSYPNSRVTFFIRTGTCADCAGRNVRIKLSCSCLSRCKGNP